VNYSTNVEQMWHFTGEGQVYHRDETSGTIQYNTIGGTELRYATDLQCQTNTRDNKVVKFITGRKSLGHQ